MSLTKSAQENRIEDSAAVAIHVAYWMNARMKQDPVGFSFTERETSHVHGTFAWTSFFVEKKGPSVEISGAYVMQGQTHAKKLAKLSDTADGVSVVLFNPGKSEVELSHFNFHANDLLEKLKATHSEARVMVGYRETSHLRGVRSMLRHATAGIF